MISPGRIAVALRGRRPRSLPEPGPTEPRPDPRPDPDRERPCSVFSCVPQAHGEHVSAAVIHPRYPFGFAAVLPARTTRCRTAPYRGLQAGGPARCHGLTVHVASAHVSHRPQNQLNKMAAVTGPCLLVLRIAVIRSWPFGRSCAFQIAIHLVASLHDLRRCRHGWSCVGAAHAERYTRGQAT